MSKTVSSFISYDNHSLIIDNNYNVWSFGDCHHGKLGKRSIFEFGDGKLSLPKQIKNLNNIQMVSCGYLHSVCLDYDGNVYSFGSNNFGQLGTGRSVSFQTPHPQKLNLPSISQISCGCYFTICLSSDGNLYSFGNNDYGELGIGDNLSCKELSPIQIISLSNISFVECGKYHVICKTIYDEYYSWGNNACGQLGQGYNNKELNEERFKNCNIPIKCNNWPANIIDIKSGALHTLLLTSKGEVYSFGDNNYGELGLNDKDNMAIDIPTLIKDMPEIQRIECGIAHSMCIDIDNKLWLFGDNTFGQLGLQQEENSALPILHPTLSNIIDISSGGNHTYIKTFDNKIYTFGHNPVLEPKPVHIIITPVQVFQNYKNIWRLPEIKSKAKSARK